MSKFSYIIFIVLCVVLIGGFLVLHKAEVISDKQDKFNTSQNLNINNDENVESKLSNNNNSDTSNLDTDNEEVIIDEKENTEIYAKSLVLDCPREITIQVGSSIKLSDNFIKIEPTKLKDKIDIYVTSKYNSNIENLKFEGNTILAKAEGYYTINFEIAKSQTSTIKESLIIHAVSQTTKIVQLVDSLFVGTNYQISDLFNIENTQAEIIFSTGDKISCLEDVIMANSIGESDIKITYIEANVTYYFEYVFMIIAKPEYEIIIENNKTFDFVQNKTYAINFEVVGKTACSQTINVELSDNSIADIITCASPTIVLKAKAKGILTLKIIYQQEQTVTKDVVIVFE